MCTERIKMLQMVWVVTLELPELIEEDQQVEKDKRTAGIIQQVANSICEYIQVEIIHPCTITNKCQY